jgi:hypothetical protein
LLSPGPSELWAPTRPPPPPQAVSVKIRPLAAAIVASNLLLLFMKVFLSFMSSTRGDDTAGHVA